jgi:AcrR family transcriptional regulator
MAADVRTQMIRGAVRLLARQGLQATSFSEVLEISGAPRGSVYHHFPGGKEQLIAAAVELAGAIPIDELGHETGAGAEEVTEHFLRMWRNVLTLSHFESGCAVLAVAVATESPELLGRTAAVFRSWRGRLAELLAGGGLSPRDAGRFATTLVASCEGAVVLSRAERSIEPFDLVAEQLREQLRRMLAAPG